MRSFCIISEADTKREGLRVQAGGSRGTPSSLDCGSAGAAATATSSTTSAAAAAATQLMADQPSESKE